tara:strand:- start:315 stop:596 length:282 start_codon:yes stop_codon:yes gene_type:complete
VSSIPGSQEEGEKFYLEKCVVCHGETGGGDGLAALPLVPKPSDSTDNIRKHGGGEGEMFMTITDGIPKNCYATLEGGFGMRNRGGIWSTILKL